jgi:hypothetical protein
MLQNPPFSHLCVSFCQYRQIQRQKSSENVELFVFSTFSLSLTGVRLFSRLFVLKILNSFFIHFHEFYNEFSLKGHEFCRFFSL